jgi:hypothetical protein
MWRFLGNLRPAKRNWFYRRPRATAKAIWLVVYLKSSVIRRSGTRFHACRLRIKNRGRWQDLETFPGAACCQPTELPTIKAAPLQAMDASTLCGRDANYPGLINKTLQRIIAPEVQVLRCSCVGKAVTQQLRVGAG